jgi:seipin
MMYNYRLLSFLFFTSTFFSVSMTSAFIAYLFFTLYMSSSRSSEHEDDSVVKRESQEEKSGHLDPLSTEDLSDTERTFPIIGRTSKPLQFSRKSQNEDVRVKEELEQTLDVKPLLGEADDEDDFDDDDQNWRDSGIGTGREDRERHSMQRRRQSLRDTNNA